MLQRDYQSYSWTRYWSPLGQESPRTDDPFTRSARTGSARSPRPLHELPHEQCQVLLGEAGSGKTDELCQLDARLDSEGRRVESIDLGDYGEAGLMRALGTVLKTRGPIYLLLDGLDETSIHNPPELLRRELQGRPEVDVRLRITCRSAYWAFRSSEFRGRLDEAFQEVGVYEIEPLKKEDVLLAAEEYGIAEPHEFWGAVNDVGVESLARKPVTLNFLFDEYRVEEGDLPTTRTKLYHSACNRLCKEVDPSRIETSRLDKEDRLRLSERMAAVSMFGQQKRIWVSPSYQESPEGSLSIENFISANEDSHHAESYRELIEATNTGLLHGGTPSKDAARSVEWVERTLAEFLAARFVIKHDLELGQLLDLLAAPTDETRGVAPQMQDIAGWISRWHDGLFEHLLRTDPHIALLGDVAALSPEKRSILSERLLQQYERKRLRPTHAWNFGTQHLSNPDLPDQLREYLKPEHDSEVRSVAINLIQQNDVKSLAGEIFQIAHADDEPHHLRVSATSALDRFGGDGAATLVTLLKFDEESHRIELLGDEEDPQRELRGSILSAVYPDTLGLENVLPSLPCPREEDSRLYTQFVENDLFEGVTSANIAAVFDRFEAWVQLASSTGESDFVRIPRVLDSFASQLFSTAASYLSKAEIRSRLAGWVYVLIKSYQDLPGRGPGWESGFDNKWAESESLRAVVLDEILNQDDLEFIPLSRGNRALRPQRDLDWVLEKAKDEESRKKRERWAKLGAHLFRCNLVDHVVPYLQVEEIREAFMEYIGKSQDLGFEGATEALREHCEEKGRQREEQTELQDLPEGEDDEPGVRPVQIEGILDDSDNLDRTEKWLAAYNLSLHDVNTGDDISDITEREVWEMADSALRHRLIKAASLFLAENQPDPSIWKESRSVWGEVEYTAMSALRLLQTEAEARLENWEDEFWEQWSPLIVAYEPVTDEDHSAIQRLATRAHERVPNVVAETLRDRIRARSQDTENPGSVRVLRTLEKVWDDRLIAVLVEAAQDPDLNTSTLSEILPVILNHGSEDDIERIESLLEESGSDSENRWQRSAEAAIAIINSSRDGFWDKIWPHLKSRDKFAQRVLGRLAHRKRTRDASIIENLKSEELASLYLRLVDLYPHEEDTERPAGEAYSPTVRDDVQTFRSAVLQALIGRGAADQIERVRDEYPHLDRLIESQRKAREEARREAWSPHPPEEVLELAGSQQARLGRSGAELFSAVKNALMALDDRLQRHTPAVYDLWSSVTRNRVLHLTQEIIQDYEDAITARLGRDRASEVAEALEVMRRKRSGNRTYRVPKGETELSDYIQRYLKRVLDEAIVSREVSVRPGKYTDLYISTVNQDEGDERPTASVVVEVKGSWNSRVYTGIQDQLVENYLAEASCRFGLYFVGWHFCETWSDSDPRKARARRGGIESHEEKLSERINDLEREGIVVHRIVADLSLPD